MKRQFKAAAVVTTAALLAMGASLTSFAASTAKTGEWKLEADGWYCYDKNGEAYTNEWCLSYGKEYFVDESGLLATYSWVEDDDKFYFVGSTGAKTVNDWRYTTAPYDEDGEEAWFWFDAKGEMETGKKVINGNTYYFDADGRMLTGWVTYEDGVAAQADNYTDAGLTYCDETGARLTNTWLQEFEPEADLDEVEDEDMNWHYIGATGGLTKGKKNDVKGKTYLFDVEGKMLSGWVESYDGSDDDTLMDDYRNVPVSIAASKASGLAGDFYFCGTEDQGYVKKDRWVNTWTPAAFDAQDDDNTKYWYLFGEDGKLFVPTAALEAHKQTFVDGDEETFLAPATGTDALVNGQFKKVGSKTYFFDTNGKMVSGFASIKASGSDATASNTYYFGGAGDGARKTGNVTIADETGVSYKFYFGEKSKNGYTEGAAVTGAANNYLYEDGKLVTHENGKYYEVELWEGTYFLINNNGAIQTSKKVYKDGADVLYNASNVAANFFFDGKLDYDYNGDGLINDVMSTMKGSYDTPLPRS